MRDLVEYFKIHVVCLVLFNVCRHLIYTYVQKETETFVCDHSCVTENVCPGLYYYHRHYYHHDCLYVMIYYHYHNHHRHHSYNHHSFLS